MKTLFFDIETYGHDFAANLGYVIVISYKWKGEKQVHTITRENPDVFDPHPENDRKLIRKFVKVVAKADMIVGWNSSRFDVPFLQARMLKHRMGVFPILAHEDMLMTARRLKIKNRSLQNIGEWLGLYTDKVRMPPELWMRAGAGHPKELKTMIKRCEHDVKLTEEAYDRLAPYSKTHPNVNIVNGRKGGCPVCGEQTLTQQGKRYALRHYRIRYKCTNQKCGHWSTSAPIRIKQ